MIRGNKVLVFVCLGVILAAATLVLAPSRTAVAASPASLSLGETVIAEGDDYATRVVGIPWWDMDGAPYPDLFTAAKNIDRSKFNITPDGFWELRSTNTDPSIWFVWSGVAGTQRVLRLGDTRPIDANKYKLLSYYMCLKNAPAANDFDWAANVYWFYDRSPLDPNDGRSAWTFFVQQGLFKKDGDCELITLDLSQPSSWAVGSWNNNPNKPTAFRLDPINQPGQDFKLGWGRLTTRDTSNPVPFNWSGAPAGENKFYVSLTGCGQDGILVGTKSGASGQFLWGAQVIPGFNAAHPLPLPESFQPGVYHLYMKDANGDIACAGNNPLTISRAPILDILKPSFQSGKDFATVELNDPWGLSNSTDIEKMYGITTANFDDGILKLTAHDPDPRLHLNLHGHSIDTSKYYYASFRFNINGDRSGIIGWVQRWVWWYTGGPFVDHVTAQDMELYEGWHTFTIDLRNAPTENCASNCWSGFPLTLRFDPFETIDPTFFEIDYFLLTGDESIQKGSVFPIYFKVKATGDAVVRFYYDNDTNPNNGRTLIGTMPLASGAPLPETPFLDNFKLFIPSVRNGTAEIDLYADALRFDWNTSNVPKNTFYISADVDDGLSVTTWYSEIPVTIK